MNMREHYTWTQIKGKGTGLLLLLYILVTSSIITHNTLK